MRSSREATTLNEALIQRTLLHRLLPPLLLTLVAVGLGGPTSLAPADAEAPDPLVNAQVALFDPGNGKWRIREAGGGSTEFFYGNPGDVILAGDWDGDGDDTVAAYRPSTGRVYVKLENSNGVADYTLSVGSHPTAVTWRRD